MKAINGFALRARPSARKLPCRLEADVRAAQAARPRERVTPAPNRRSAACDGTGRTAEGGLIGQDPY
jgi:hypothetical protein